MRPRFALLADLVIGDIPGYKLDRVRYAPEIGRILIIYEKIEEKVPVETPAKKSA